jgi:hypothetical protein
VVLRGQALPGVPVNYGGATSPGESDTRGYIAWEDGRQWPISGYYPYDTQYNFSSYPYEGYAYPATFEHLAASGFGGGTWYDIVEPGVSQDYHYKSGTLACTYWKTPFDERVVSSYGPQFGGGWNELMVRSISTGVGGIGGAVATLTMSGDPFFPPSSAYPRVCSSLTLWDKDRLGVWAYGVSGFVDKSMDFGTSWASGTISSLYPISSSWPMYGQHEISDTEFPGMAYGSVYHGVSFVSGGLGYRSMWNFDSGEVSGFLTVDAMAGSGLTGYAYWTPDSDYAWIRMSSTPSNLNIHYHPRDDIQYGFGYLPDANYNGEMRIRWANCRTWPAILGLIGTYEVLGDLFYPNALAPTGPPYGFNNLQLNMPICYGELGGISYWAIFPPTGHTIAAYNVNKRFQFVS